MVKFQISPSKDFVFVKWLLILLSAVVTFFTFTTWIMVFFGMWDISESLVTAIILSFFSVIILYSCMLFVNYDILFTADYIVVTNWLNQKKKFYIDDIDKKAYKYRIFTTKHIVFLDKNGKKLFKTKYGKKKYFDYLESIGFTIDKPNIASMIF